MPKWSSQRFLFANIMMMKSPSPLGSSQALMVARRAKSQIDFSKMLGRQNIQIALISDGRNFQTHFQFLTSENLGLMLITLENFRRCLLPIFMRNQLLTASRPK